MNALGVNPGDLGVLSLMDILVPDRDVEFLHRGQDPIKSAGLLPEPAGSPRTELSASDALAATDTDGRSFFFFSTCLELPGTAGVVQG
jgi:hypothetical protein